jgi:hypothetical protein
VKKVNMFLFSFLLIGQLFGTTDIATQPKKNKPAIGKGLAKMGIAVAAGYALFSGCAIRSPRYVFDELHTICQQHEITIEGGKSNKRKAIAFYGSWLALDTVLAGSLVYLFVDGLRDLQLLEKAKKSLHNFKQRAVRAS